MWLLAQSFDGRMPFEGEFWEERLIRPVDLYPSFRAQGPEFLPKAGEGAYRIETFFVAPGSGAAPVVHSTPPFPDASSNPAFSPTHTFHVGLWFNSAADAQAVGCPGTVTPFNGDHTAGIQVLSSRNFPSRETNPG